MYTQLDSNKHYEVTIKANKLFPPAKDWASRYSLYLDLVLALATTQNIANYGIPRQLKLLQVSTLFHLV